MNSVNSLSIIDIEALAILFTVALSGTRLSGFTTATIYPCKAVADGIVTVADKGVDPFAPKAGTLLCPR